MGAVLVDVAEAVKAELETGSFTLAITPERSYADWEDELESDEAGRIRCDVVPVQIARSELDARGELVYMAETDIGIRRRFDNDAASWTHGRVQLGDVDQLCQLVEQIHEFFAENNGRRLSTLTGATWEASEIRASYVRDHLREWRQFTGIVRVTYRAYSELSI